LSNSYSVASLVGTIRTRTSQINSAQFSDTVELIPWVRNSLKQLYEVLTSRWVDWYTIQRPLSLQTFVERYTLPADYRAMQAVYMVYQNAGAGSVYREQLRGMPRSKFGRYGNLNVARRWPLLYRIEAGKLFLTPAPSADYVNAIEFHYTPQWSGPLLDWSPIDVNGATLPNGWEEFVVLDVMQKMMMKNGKDINDILKMKTEVMNRVVAGAAQRDSEPPQMRDVYDTGSNACYNGTPGGLQTWALG
jgi:hypothetical protein